MDEINCTVEVLFVNLPCAALVFLFPVALLDMARTMESLLPSYKHTPHLFISKGATVGEA
ncbi:uncharacterized protein BDV14DRAFT_170461 [Aspergillus stella-maris]|uniref:uncharacterized protein n=1 Tax=Aspergillus stella-maris TaxID=1810926 RepID=UPI003CCE232E